MWQVLASVAGSLVVLLQGFLLFVLVGIRTDIRDMREFQQGEAQRTADAIDRALLLRDAGRKAAYGN